MRPRRVEEYSSTRLRVGRGAVALLILGLLILGTYAAVRYTDWFTRLGRSTQTIAQGQLPPWMLQKTRSPAPEVNGVTPAVAKEDPNAALRAELARLRSELDALKRKPAPTPAPPKPAPPAVKRPPMYFVSAERPKEAKVTEALYQTSPWLYIPCVLENVLHSEIEGMFTVKTTRPVWDAQGRHVLIPQGQRIGAKDASAQLLFGNERIPTWALSVAMPDGSAVDLGQAPIMDAAGMNGLTGIVDNHTWRIVWTSVLIEGLRLGQQVMNQSIANAGEGITVTGVGQYSSNLAQQRLGRGQDTRPTITVASGEQCNILVPKPLSLPAITLASR